MQHDKSTKNGGETPLPGPAAPAKTSSASPLNKSVNASQIGSSDKIKRPLPLSQSPSPKIDANGSPPPVPPPRQPPPANGKAGNTTTTPPPPKDSESPPKRVRQKPAVRAHSQKDTTGIAWKVLFAIGAIVCMAATGWALREFRSQNDANEFVNDQPTKVSTKQLSDDQLLYEVLDRADQERRTAEILDSLKEDEDQNGETQNGETQEGKDNEDALSVAEDETDFNHASDEHAVDKDASVEGHPEMSDSNVLPASHHETIASAGDATPREADAAIVAAPVATPRMSIPLAPDLLKADAEMQRIYRDAFRDDDPGSMALTVEMLLADAQSEGVTDAERYLRYQKAFEMALEANATTAADEAYQLLTTEFETDSLSLRTSMIEKLAEQTRQTSEYWRLGNAALEHANLLIDNRLYREAEKMVEIAANFGLRVSAPRLRLAAKEAEVEIERLRSLEQLQQVAETLLTRDPANATGNLNRGMFLCFAIGHWETGLAHLQRAKIPELAAVATLDLAGPTELADRLEVANAWYDLANSDEQFEPFFARADAWYLSTIPYLKLGQIREVDKRMKAIERKRFSQRMLRLCEVGN